MNSKKFLTNDFNIFMVANDKYNLYPTIAERSGLKIVNQFKRPVLNRTERDKLLVSSGIGIINIYEDIGEEIRPVLGTVIILFE